MYQAMVKFVASGRTMHQEWDTKATAVDSLVGLLIATGYDVPADELRAMLTAGGVVHFGTRDYWVQEAP